MIHCPKRMPEESGLRYVTNYAQNDRNTLKIDILSGTLQRYEILHFLSCNPSQKAWGSIGIHGCKMRGFAMSFFLKESITEFYRVLLRAELIVENHKPWFGVHEIFCAIIFSEISPETCAIISKKFFFNDSSSSCQPYHGIWIKIKFRFSKAGSCVKMTLSIFKPREKSI